MGFIFLFNICRFHFNNMLTDIILVNILLKSTNVFLLTKVDILCDISILFLCTKSFRNVKTRKSTKRSSY